MSDTKEIFDALRHHSKFCAVWSKGDCSCGVESISHENSPHGASKVSQGTLIGLGGKLRAGKDAVGDYLEEHHGYVKLGMSDALNEALLALNPLIPLQPFPADSADTEGRTHIPYRQYHDALGYVRAKTNPEVRRLLQVLGTEVGRDMIGQDVWVNIAEKRIQGLLAEGKNVVITAVRFPNELEMLDRLGGTSVWIERSDEARGASEGSSGHASEQSVSAEDFQYHIQNNGTLDELYDSVEAARRWISTAPIPPSGVNAQWPAYDR